MPLTPKQKTNLAIGIGAGIVLIGGSIWAANYFSGKGKSDESKEPKPVAGQGKGSPPVAGQGKGSPVVGGVRGGVDSPVIGGVRGGNFSGIDGRRRRVVRLKDIILTPAQQQAGGECWKYGNKTYCKDCAGCLAYEII